MQPRRVLLSVFVAVTVLWVGYRAYRAYANLVTLSVRNMDVHRVVSKLEWQTWKRIVVNKNVVGKVTLDVHNVPLDEVLNIVSLQTDARWTRLYPIYSTRKSIAAFHQVLRGDLPPAKGGWLSVQKLGFWQRNGMGAFANALRTENNLVSAQFLNKDLSFATFALSRFSKAEVVPEDGARGMINLKLQQVPFENAVAKVARQVHRKWDRCYALQPLNTSNVVSVVVRPASGGPVAPAPPTPVEPAPLAIEREGDKDPITPERAMEAFAATMSPQERQQVQRVFAGGNPAGGPVTVDRQQAQAIEAQATQAAQADMERRIQNRLKYGTVDQRVARDRQQLVKQRATEKP
jgi:hypothetical protein